METSSEHLALKRKSGLRFGLVAGIAFAFVQFLVSEMLFQASMLDEGDLGYYAAEFGDLVAFPAGFIYDHYSNLKTLMLLEESLASNPTRFTSEDLETANETLQTLQANPHHSDVSWSAYELLEKYEIDTTLTLTAEYSIYAGTCLFWGLIIGLIVGFFFYAVTPEPKDEPRSSRT
ncbi:MAG: hypothetical protein AAGB46_19030 [Verrucomicrobiota bacterium]